LHDLVANPHGFEIACGNAYVFTRQDAGTDFTDSGAWIDDGKGKHIVGFERAGEHGCPIYALVDDAFRQGMSDLADDDVWESPLT
jgi:hypothetical protein